VTAHPSRLNGIDLESVIWASEALVCAVTDPASTIVAANPAFVRLARGNPIGQPLAAFVGDGQADAFGAWVESLGRAWESRIWGGLPDAHDLPRDFRVSACRRPDGDIVLIGERLVTDDVAGALLDVNKSMVREHRRIDRDRGRLDKMAQQDALTGIANRRALDTHLAAEVRGADPDAVFAVVMLDLDHFKNVNDRYGHPAGDVVLRWLGGLLRTAARRTDFVARYGGEEFVAILRDAGASDALAWAERLRLAIREAPPPGVPETVTASLGVAVWRPGDSAGYVVDRADRALYAAKEGGRDRVGEEPAVAPAHG
jgi:diguanylate cyclase (GGDEF)-like protein